MPGYVNREVIFMSKPGNAPDMICMLVRNENCPYCFHGKAKQCHAFLGFTAAYTGINQHGISMVADIIAIAITA